MTRIVPLAALPRDWVSAGDGDGDVLSALGSKLVALNSADVNTTSTAGLSDMSE